jgi:galactan 5-O-arabinofuranosyltransferase
MLGRVVTLLRPWLLAAVFLGAGWAAVTRLDFDPRGPLVSMALQLVLAGLVAAAAGLSVASRPTLRPWAMDVIAAAMSAWIGVVLAVALHGSTYSVGGLGIAAANRTPAAVRFAETWHLVDYSYKGLPAFYPSLLPWVAGRLAALTDLTPWLALKVVNIAAMTLAPIAGYVLWSRILRPQLAMFVPVAMAALATLLPVMLQQPDTFVAVAVVVPWWIDAVYGVRRPPVRAWPFWLAGLIGALVFCLYYYFYFPLALALLLMPVLDRMHRPLIAHPYRQRALVLGTAAALAAVYWLPVAVSILRAQDPVSLQNFWFRPDMAVLRVDVFQPSLAGAVMLLGLAHLLLTCRRDRTSLAMLLVLAAGYLWYVLSAVGNLVGLPVLGNRTVPFLDLVLLVAGIRGGAALLTAATRALIRSRGPETARPMLVAPVVLALLAFVVGQQYATTTLAYGHVRQSHDTPLPNGRLQPYASPGTRAPSVSEHRLEEAVRTRWSGLGEPVVLSTNVPLLKLSGFYAFNQWHAIYANPAGEFYARVDLVRRLAGTRSPAEFDRLARANRFDPIDAFVLRGRGQSLRYQYIDVTYPYGAGRKTVAFRRAQFSPSYWRTTQVGGYFVAVRR